MAWAKLETKDGTGTTTITLDGITDGTIFNQILNHNEASSGGNNNGVRLGSTTIDTGNNYAFRYSRNGGTDITVASQNNMTQHNAAVTAVNQFAISYIINISTEEKLMINHSMEAGTAGAGNAPQRTESVGKWDNTSNEADVIGVVALSGNLNSNSNLSALGTD